MSAVVELVEGVVDAVDKYIIEPIAKDPLTFIATTVGFTLGGPIGAAAANTAAGLAQGEDFDEALKGGVIAGATSWAGQQASQYFGAPSSSSASTLQKGISSTADDLVSAGSQNIDDVLASAAKESALGLDDVVSFGSKYGDDLISPAAKNWGGNLADDALSFADDALTRGAPLEPINPFAPPSLAAPKLPTTPPPPTTGAGVYTGQKIAGMGDAAVNAGAASQPSYYQAFDGPASVASSAAGTNQGILDSPLMQYGTGDISPGIMNSPTPIAPPSMWDKALGYAGKAYDWAVDNPMYSIPLALSATSLLSQGKPDGQPSGGGSQGQIGESSFYEPLDLYRMNRGQLGYEGDIYSYGTQGGEHDFFSPTVYEPIRYAQGGDVTPMRDNPMRDEYGYYTYGQIPRTMRKFAKGGLSALATQESFDGRSDDIPAVLSDGEFVVDAETVALLGNGSSKAGANKLEQMRQAVRKQKGGALSQGKFSPDAKHPLAYLKSSKRGRG